MCCNTYICSIVRSQKTNHIHQSPWSPVTWQARSQRRASVVEPTRIIWDMSAPRVFVGVTTATLLIWQKWCRVTSPHQKKNGPTCAAFGCKVVCFNLDVFFFWESLHVQEKGGPPPPPETMQFLFQWLGFQELRSWKIYVFLGGDSNVSFPRIYQE